MNRIIQVDFFRGLFLIIITTNHFLSWHNIIFYFTSEFIGWVTAAEGFVFLSGLTAGIVYSRKLVEKGEAFITLAARKRAWTIYKYHLILFLLAIIIIFSHSFMIEFWFVNYEDFKLILRKPVLAMLLGSTLLYQPIYLDILPMYALYILLLPLTLKYLDKGKHGLVLACSFIVYLIGTFNPVSKLFDHFNILTEVETGFFNLLSWQLLFIGGLYLGFLTYKNKTSYLLQNKKLFYSAILVCIVLFVFRNVTRQADNLQLNLDYWISKENLGPLRLLNFSAILMVMSYLASRYKQWFSFEPVCHLGKYSLEVFSLHILLVFIFKPWQDLTNDFHAVKLTNSLYFYPWGTVMLLLVLLPALFLAPWLKNSVNKYKLLLKSAV